MFSGFIFDVEGTLVDSVPQNLRSLQDALKRSGYRLPYQTLQLFGPRRGPNPAARYSGSNGQGAEEYPQSSGHDL